MSPQSATVSNFMYLLKTQQERHKNIAILILKFLVNYRMNGINLGANDVANLRILVTGKKCGNYLLLS